MGTLSGAVVGLWDGVQTMEGDEAGVVMQGAEAVLLLKPQVWHTTLEVVWTGRVMVQGQLVMVKVVA